MTIGRYEVRGSVFLHRVGAPPPRHEILIGGRIFRLRVGPVVLGYLAWWKV